METNTIVQADALTYLQSLPSESVHCMITSPPYWGLRDYGVPGQLGLEPTLAEYLSTMTAIFEEARRVLRPDGTLWLNMGDGYANASSGGSSVFEKGRTDGRPGDGGKDRIEHYREILKHTNTITDGLKPKDLIGQPWRLAFRLQDDGWWLRSDIIWAKPNPMPESVTDRPTKAHEYVFLLTKSARYWYDAYAIREPHKEASLNRYKHGFNRDKQANDGYVLADNYTTVHGNPAGRNKRTVWTVATAPMKAAHFASFPPKLIEPMILAGCPPKVCVDCGAPWVRVVETGESDWQHRKNNGAAIRGDDKTGHIKTHGKGTDHTLGQRARTTTGWNPTCDCNGDTEPGIVLDMFMGAGTVALVAIKHGRRWMGCELNADYIAIAEDRISAVQVDMFTSRGM